MLLEPFERLKEALSRRGQGPTAAEIEEFVKTRKGDSSRKMKEFITLLKSLKEPMEEPERKAARREARKQLGPADGNLREPCLAVCAQMRESPIFGKSGRADGSGRSALCASAKTGGLLLAPDVAPYQRLREGPAGNTAKKRC